MQITKVIEFDAGHRVPNHKSKCRNIHGHRYKCEVMLEGDVIREEGISDEGMVMDFSDVKRIANDFLDGEFDHGFIAYEGDTEIIEHLKKIKSKLYVVSFIPTAENLAQHIFEILDIRFTDVYGTGLKLKRIRLWETPTSYADYTL